MYSGRLYDLKLKYVEYPIFLVRSTHMNKMFNSYIPGICTCIPSSVFKWNAKMLGLYIYRYIYTTSENQTKQYLN